ncbi:DNA topoisomerase III [Anaerotignum lactatifermentans]|jgi:DNA topoisomerase III|uniref:DNA topoisomerase n=2 Tax=Anaerotignum TaxID=2039240 RepID=A0A1Y3TRZ3_9FIRM|nr:DNA topoisomerase III [Anaerotignum lactatifermentans]OUN39304.1 DNA topoisomerase III [Anaerotignum lactatifermentans]
MGKTLVIAEKPSVARDIAKTLGVSGKNEGYLTGENYVVSWAIGHLVTLAEPEAYDVKYKKWNFETLPILPDSMKLEAIKKTRSQLKVLHKLMHSREIDEIICATDSGREGELIFRYIYEITQCRKPFRRLWISSMTETAIREGFAHLQDGSHYDLLYHSARCRAEADWLVGMNASRAYTIRYGALLSIGRVQTPTLALIVEKQKEIDAFVPQDYFEVQADFEQYTGFWIDEKENTRLDLREKAEQIAARVKGQRGIVSQIVKEEKRQLPPLLYDLTELQRECNRKFGFSAKKTLDIAQSLYEKRKMITYPRTDSRYLSDDMVGKIKQTLGRLKDVQEFSPYAAEVLAKEKLPLSKRIIDNSKVTDHHAIIPTDTRLRTDHLTPEENKVFSLVAARFLAVFYPAYVYEATKVYTKVGLDTFLSKGKTVLQEGWQAVEKALLPETRKNKTEKEEEQQLPPLTEQQPVVAKRTKVLDKKTKAPPPYTESTLLSAMENAGRFVEDEELKEQMKDSGLGTPATRAAIIERLLSVGYIMRKGKTLVPTEKGQKLIAVVPEELRSPQTTGKWEKGLSSIAKGKMTEERFLESIRRYVRFLVDDAAQHKKDVVFEAERPRGKRSRAQGLGKCPLCGKGKILENSRSYYCTEWKNGCKFSLWKDSTEPYGILLDAPKVKRLLKGEKLEKIPVVLPQTGERGTADLILSPDHSGRVELMNVTRSIKE